jgi:heterodisulfide reductase subunit A2
MTQHKEEKVGSVLVVGGGIAGVQASLDLANAGFFVHLVEKKPAIGGVVVQLDRSYPTNESAMCVICMMSPNLMECGRNKAEGGLDYEVGACGRHKNIEIHNLAEVKKLEGGPGNFTVTVEKAPRYVDPLKCISCGACTEVCPISIPDEFNLNG